MSALKIERRQSVEDVGAAAAEHAARCLRDILGQKGVARVVVATGVSQFAFLNHLSAAHGIAWPQVTMFHLDEYVGLPADHPASFRRYLQERIIDRVHPGTVVLINGEADPDTECLRIGELISAAPIDLAFLGIGENGHLAFNDPPANFETTRPYLVVTLDQACRAQQVGEGWFSSLADVPRQAITMSIHQIMSAETIICIAPERRKAAAVRACLEDEISPHCPASILRTHPNATLYLDAQSASLLDKNE